MKNIRKFLTASICFLFPIKFSFWILNLLGHKVHASAKIGFSLILIKDRLLLDKSTRIGHFNLIKIDNIEIKKSGYINNFNSIKGPLDIHLSESAALGNNNRIYRAPIGVTYGKAVLRLGILSKITANHRVDCTRSVTIGNYSTIAGHDTQIWTHAYYHDKTGPGRFRLDGEVLIGNNVYIGSRCILNMGIQIVDTVIVGGNSAISKSLLKPGTYVNQALRHIEDVSASDARLRFKKVEQSGLCEEVYEKK